MEVAQEQIKRTLGKSTNVQQLTIFRERLFQLSYSEITRIWQRERKSKEEWESQATPIVYIFTNFHFTHYVPYIKYIKYQIVMEV